MKTDRRILKVLWFRLIIPINRYYTFKIERLIDKGYSYYQEFYPDEVYERSQSEDFYHTER